MSAPHYVLDACAVIAFLSGEPGADKVKSLLELAVTSEANVCIHRINLLEVYYDVYKIGGTKQADEVYRKLLSLPITVDERLTDALFFKAGELKATNKFSLADAIAIALAIDLKAWLVTSDHHEFDSIEVKGIAEFLWIR
jgi:predicted nucleic acid-binding protein